MSAPGYDEIAAMMASYGDAMEASECHGILAGMLSCHPQLDGNSWAEKMLSGEFEEQGEAAPATVDEADKATLAALYDETEKQMADEELGFQLLLPGDDDGLIVRTEALASWCSGYLYGLSLGGIKDFGGFSEQVQDFCNDMVTLSNLAPEEEESEETESAFFEITEYVRLGALMVADELGGKGGGTPPEEHKITFH